MLKEYNSQEVLIRKHGGLKTKRKKIRRRKGVKVVKERKMERNVMRRVVKWIVKGIIMVK